jgi:hyaluronan synthase
VATTDMVPDESSPPPAVRQRVDGHALARVPPGPSAHRGIAVAPAGAKPLPATPVAARPASRTADGTCTAHAGNVRGPSGRHRRKTISSGLRSSESSARSFARLQREGLAALVMTSRKQELASDSPHARCRADNSFVRHIYAGLDASLPISLAERKITPGALAAKYELPRIRFRTNRTPWLLAVSVLLIARLFEHLLVLETDQHLYSSLIPVIVLSLIFTAFQQLMSLCDRPHQVTPEQQLELDLLHVTVAVPVYNEDPELLDRCIWSMVNCSRPPDVIHVVEDGEQTVDYLDLRSHWTRLVNVPVQIIWTRTPVNRGKKWAQSEAFSTHPETDIFITVDSDTALEYDAVAEGMKPFADQAISSVAGIEVMFNSHASWLTRSVASRNTVYQLVTWGAQSAVGNLLVNRGTYALYRAEIVREIIPAYVGETFLGHAIKLGDDAALALFARDRGRTVQQVTAFSLPMCAETFSHHFRQFTRWMRGKAIRDCWRLKYLPVLSYGWLYTVFTIFTCLMSTAVTVLVLVTFPTAAWVFRYSLLIMIIWSLAAGTRVFCISRSDETTWEQIVSWLVYPSALLWVMFVLRPLRFYGAVTCLRQGWVTRVSGVEVAITAPEQDMIMIGERAVSEA